MGKKNTHSVTKTEISVFGRQALDAERRRSPSLADRVLIKAHSEHFFAFADDMGGGSESDVLQLPVTNRR